MVLLPPMQPYRELPENREGRSRDRPASVRSERGPRDVERVREQDDGAARKTENLSYHWVRMCAGVGPRGWPVAGGRPRVAGCQWPVAGPPPFPPTGDWSPTGHRPPATGHRPPATGHRQLATGHRQLATGHRPPATRTGTPLATGTDDVSSDARTVARQL